MRSFSWRRERLGDYWDPQAERFLPLPYVYILTALTTGSASLYRIRMSAIMVTEIIQAGMQLYFIACVETSRPASASWPLPSLALFICCLFLNA